MSPTDKRYLAQFMASAMNGILANPGNSADYYDSVVYQAGTLAASLLEEYKAKIKSIKTNPKEA